LEARKQAKYIEAVSSNAFVDPAVLRILQRKYKPFAPRPIKEPSVFYGVRLGHVPGVYTSWKEAKPHTVGILSDYKRFKTRTKAEEYVAQVTTSVVVLKTCGGFDTSFINDFFYSSSERFRIRICV